MVLIILLTALALLAAAFVLVLARTAVKRGTGAPGPESIILGAVANFFDTLGIGSFAPTTAWLRFRKMTPDSFIPATLNVGHALPTMVQSAVFLVLLGVHVDPMLLVSCIVAAVAGAVVGAPLMVRAPVRVVQGIVGVALLIAAALYAMSNLDLMPIGGTATALEPRLMWIAVEDRATEVDGNDAVTDLDDEFHVVLDEQHAHTPGCRDLAEDLAESGGFGSVQTGCRLVEQQHGWR